VLQDFDWGEEDPVDDGLDSEWKIYQERAEEGSTEGREGGEWEGETRAGEKKNGIVYLSLVKPSWYQIVYLHLI